MYEYVSRDKCTADNSRLSHIVDSVGILKYKECSLVYVNPRWYETEAPFPIVTSRSLKKKGIVVGSRAKNFV